MLKKTLEKTNLLSTVKPLTLAIITALGTGMSSHAYSAAGDVVGVEYKVSTAIGEEEWESNIAMNAQGSSVVTWSAREVPNGNGSFEIYVQRYATDGAKAGSELLVNVIGAGDNSTPDVAIDASGNFVVVWKNNGQDGDGFGIYGQRFNATGTKVGAEFLVNTNIVEDQENPQVAMNATGNFVVTWQSNNAAADDINIFAQRYSADGNTVGGEFSVNTATNEDQSNPSITMNDVGRFVVTWQSGSNGSENVYAQPYQTDGNALGAEFIVNTTTNNGQLNSSVAMDATGGFIVTWDSFGQEPTTPSGATKTGVYAQRFDVNGDKIGGDFLVNTERAHEQKNPRIAMNISGDFVVTWQSEKQTNAVDGDFDIYAQRFDNTGAAIGDEFLVNTEIEQNQTKPVVAIDSNGDFTIAWQSDGRTLGGGVYDIYAQNYEGNTTTTPATNNNAGGSGGGGALGWLSGLLLLPFALRRKCKVT